MQLGASLVSHPCRRHMLRIEVRHHHHPFLQSGLLHLPQLLRIRLCFVGMRVNGGCRYPSYQYSILSLRFIRNIGYLFVPSLLVYQERDYFSLSPCISQLHADRIRPPTQKERSSLFPVMSLLEGLLRKLLISAGDSLHPLNFTIFRTIIKTL